MKKRNIIGIIIAIIIVLAVASYFIYNIVVENGKKYEISEVKQYNYLVLKQGEKSGVMDKKGNVIISVQYDDVKIPNPEKPIFICYEEENIKVLNERNEAIFTEYEDVEPIRLKNVASDLMYEKSVLIYKQNEKYGLIDFEGKKLTNPIYEEISGLPYKEGELLVKENEKYGVINIKGNKLIEIGYEQITVDGYYTDENQYKYAGYIVSVKTEEGYRYGYIDYLGKEIQKTEYNELLRVSEIKDNNNIYLICAKNGQYGITKNEKAIISNEYQSIRYDAENSIFVVEKSKKYGISNLDGTIIVPIEYNQIDITGIYLYAQNSQGTTVYNSNGAQVNVDINISIINTENEKYRIRINNTDGTKYGVIDNNGKQIIEEKYNYIEYLFDDYFLVSNENSKLGIIDNKDNKKLEIKYDAIQKLQNKNVIQATISETKVVNLYDNKLSLICEMQNVNVNVKDDYIKISNETDIKYFNNDGQELENTQVYTNNKLFAKRENDKWGFVNNLGEVVVDYQYDKVTEFNEFGFAAIQKDGKWGSINEQGSIVVEPVYELKEEPSFINNYYKVTYGFGEFYFTDDK